ncbi:hypothetical protein ACJMK2_004391 [Sinanodonta woodiana]|uniref:Uncharacterized protein n=1 Tax=Sinanodonta woodiana TaxID=1069815 RepID=A0ABD3Y0Z9_SINWO
MAAKRQECSICMDDFKSPKLISCHHSFCHKCLEDYVRANLRNGRFDCPLCRKSVELPKEGVSGFQANFYIDADNELKSEKMSCDLCGPKTVAFSRCLDCEENLCPSCCHGHEKSKATKHHKISDLGTLDPEMKGKIRQRIFCDEHPDEEIKLVCQTCNVLICVLCKAISHENHASQTVANAAAEVKRTIELALNKCTERQKLLIVTAKNGEEYERKINEQEKKEMEAIELQHAKLIEAINQKVAQTKTIIRRFYENLRSEYTDQISKVRDEIKLCCVGNSNAAKILNQDTLTDIIKKGPDLEQRLSKVSSRENQTVNTILTKALFVPAEIKPSELISLIGTAEDNRVCVANKTTIRKHPN